MVFFLLIEREGRPLRETGSVVFHSCRQQQTCIKVRRAAQTAAVASLEEMAEPAALETALFRADPATGTDEGALPDLSDGSGLLRAELGGGMLREDGADPADPLTRGTLADFACAEIFGDRGKGILA